MRHRLNPAIGSFYRHECLLRYEIEMFDIRMPPDVWGPNFWATIHIATLGYPTQPTEEDKVNARKFFESLRTMIPCSICREHYQKHLQESPLGDAVESRGQLIYWAWELHNRVNVMLGKREYTIEEMMENLQRMGADASKKEQNKMLMLGAGLVIGVALGAGGMWAMRRLK
jgi:hypothetical protein